MPQALNSSMHSSMFESDLHTEVSAIRNSSLQKLPCRIHVIFVDLTTLIPSSFLVYSVASFGDLYPRTVGLDPTSTQVKQNALCCALQASLKHSYQQYSFPKEFPKTYLDSLFFLLCFGESTCPYHLHAVHKNQRSS